MNQIGNSLCVKSDIALFYNNPPPTLLIKNNYNALVFVSNVGKNKSLIAELYAIPIQEVEPVKITDFTL